jgi:hypothetical protein
MPWSFPGARRVCVVLLLGLVALIGLRAPSHAWGHDRPHADDFAGERELPAPPGIESAPAITGGIAPLTIARGPRKVAVIMFDFAGSPSTPFTEDAVRTAVFTGVGSVNAFEQEQSFGAISLAGKLRPDGDIFGWYTISSSAAVCDPDTWMVAANSEAAAAGVDLAGYQHRIYLFPRVAACAWAGAADMPGSDSFINGTLSVRVIAHELGHNIGAHHASTIDCTDGGVRVAFSGTCTQSEYGDPFDVMGASLRHSAAFRKVEYGFLPAGHAATVTQSGTYQVASASAAAGAVQSLRVKRGAAPDYWYIELRSQAGAFDNFGAADPPVTGIGLRLAGDYGIGVRTRLIDATPQTATSADAPLQAGQQFTDPLSGISIAADSVALGTAMVRVTLPGVSGTPPPAASAPSIMAPDPSPPARIVVAAKRIDRKRILVRVALPAPDDAERCAARLTGLPWGACRIAPGRTVAFARLVAVHPRAATIVAAVRFDADVPLVVRLRVPPIGRPVRVVQAIR